MSGKIGHGPRPSRLEPDCLDHPGNGHARAGIGADKGRFLQDLLAQTACNEKVGEACKADRAAWRIGHLSQTLDRFVGRWRVDFVTGATLDQLGQQFARRQQILGPCEADLATEDGCCRLLRPRNAKLEMSGAILTLERRICFVVVNPDMAQPFEFRPRSSADYMRRPIGKDEGLTGKELLWLSVCNRNLQLARENEMHRDQTWITVERDTPPFAEIRSSPIWR